jgi:cytoskeleton protein RodZ
METYGAYLKALREEKGKTLEEIAESTKIAVSNLDFIEKDRFDLLPPRVFVKGFIRSYALELGVSPEEALKRFEAFTSEGELPEYGEEDHPVFHGASSSRSLLAGKWLTVGLTVLGAVSLAILLLTLVTRFVPDNSPEGTRRPKVTTVEPNRKGTGGARIESDQAMDQAGFSEPARTQAGKKVLEVKAFAGAWVRVEPDGGPAEELVMSPGDVQIFTAANGFSVQTGNAGGIRLRLDGREYPPLGKMNQTLSLTLP